VEFDLIDCNGLVIQNIDSNFYYEGFVDSNGISQIAFEFGNIGVDYWTKPLYLKITDLVNDNIYYSNGFLVTNYKSELTSRFDYSNPTKIYNISYDLAPYTQSVRLFNCYDNTPVNKRDVKQYVTSQGKQVNYRTITTFLRQYYIDQLDYFVNDRLEVLFSHAIIYCNNQRVVVSEYSIQERKGNSNWFNGEFIINPQGETFTFEYQLFEPLELISKNPLGVYTLSSLPLDITGYFNKNITANTGNVYIYKDGLLHETMPIEGFFVNENFFTNSIEFLITENGNYSIRIDSGVFTSNIGEVYGGINNNTDWAFTVTDGEYDAGDYETTEYLTE